jgi:glycosyltransferase involved in cell wall biosynthesis
MNSGAHPRIAHIIGDLNGFGGTETTLLGYLRNSNVPRDCHRVIVLKSIGVGSTVGVQVVQSGISVVALDHRGFWGAMLTIWRLVRQLRAFEPDVISGWLYAPSFLTAISVPQLSRRASQVWHIRSLPFGTLLKEPGRYLTQRILAGLSRLIHPRLVSNSHAAMKAHQRIGFECSLGSWTIIPNGVDVERYFPDERDRSSIRAELGIPTNALLIGCIGRLAPEKGYAVMFEALSVLLRRIRPELLPHLHFLAAGNEVASTNPVFSRLSVKSGISSTNLHLLGRRPDTDRLLRALDIFVLPSVSESFPNSLIEAMATALPCIASNVGDCSEVLPATLVVPAGNAYALAQRMIELLEADPQSRQRIGKRNRDEVMKRFGISKMARAFDAVFIEAASARSREG